MVMTEPTPLESNIVDKVKTWCDKNGVLYIKFTPMGSKGWPDTILVFPGGFHLWTELKRLGKTPRKLQVYRMQQLATMGALAVWFDNAAACMDYLQDCLDSAIETMEGIYPPPVQAPKPEDLKPAIILPFGTQIELRCGTCGRLSINVKSGDSCAFPQPTGDLCTGTFI